MGGPTHSRKRTGAPRDTQAQRRRSAVAPEEQITALQRARGNAAVARLLAGRRVTRATIMRGKLSSTLSFLENKWDSFVDHTDDMRGTLFDDFGPMLQEYTKAAGTTKQKAKAKKGSGLVFDPEKVRATEVAHGLAEWLTSASEGAERYYAEMRQSLQILGSGSASLAWQFGVSDLTQPDAFSSAGASFESKRTRSASPSAVDTLIREARYQSTQRVLLPNNAPFVEWHIGIEIADTDNPWPYTPTDISKAGIDVDDVPKLVVANSKKLPKAPASRVGERNLAPQKGKKKAGVPLAQAGKHKLTLFWLDKGLSHSFLL